MIRVRYERRKHRLCALGHADFAREGQDIVCAAASALIFTLARCAAQLCAAAPEKYALKALRLKSGDAEIWLAAADDSAAVAALVFDSLFAGLELLAEQYPQRVRAERV